MCFFEEAAAPRFPRNEETASKRSRSQRAVPVLQLVKLRDVVYRLVDGFRQDIHQEKMPPAGARGLAMNGFVRIPGMIEKCRLVRRIDANATSLDY